jgi:hypothetical protein
MDGRRFRKVAVVMQVPPKVHFRFEVEYEILGRFCKSVEQ